MTPEQLIMIIRLGFITVLLWFCSRLFEMWRVHRTSKLEKNSYLRALFAEIDFNTSDLKKFVSTAPSKAQFKAAFKKAEFIPHITDARHTDVYRSQIDRLHQLDDDLVQKVVRFYGTLDKIKARIDGVHQPSFTLISAQGRLNVMIRLIDISKETYTNGEEILESMRDKYDALGLKRRDGSSNDNATGYFKRKISPSGS